MATRYFGEPIKRNEDPRLLRGEALFVDDVNLPDMLHVAFLRSDYAHGNILSIEADSARQRDGVVAIYTAEDLGDYWQPGPLLVPPPLAENDGPSRTNPESARLEWISTVPAPPCSRAPMSGGLTTRGRPRRSTGTSGLGLAVFTAGLPAPPFSTPYSGSAGLVVTKTRSMSLSAHSPA